MRKRAVVDAKAFSAALDQVSKALGKSHIPVLREVHVRIHDGSCEMTATDLDIWLINKVSSQGDDISFVFCRTLDVARACRLLEGDLTLELDDTGKGKDRKLMLYMYSGNRAMEFEVMAPEDYPDYSFPDPKAAFSVNAGCLSKRIERVRYAAGKPSIGARPTAYCVQFTGNQVFAMDGIRLACDTDRDLLFPRPFITSADALSHLGLFGNKEISIELGERRGRFTDGTAIVDFCIVSVDVYPLEGAIPERYAEEFSVQTGDLLREVKYLKELAAKDPKPHVRFHAGELFMATSTGKYRTSVEICGKNEITFAFDLNKMMDALRQFKSAPRVTVKLSSALAPFILEADGRDDFALICPVRQSGRLMAA